MNAENFSDALRHALKDWNTLKALGDNPLVQLAAVQHHRRAASYTDTPAGRGLALREVLQSALDALRPAPGEPVLKEKRWRPYVILVEQFLHGCSPEWVREQLHISKATYYAEQTRALEWVCSRLGEWEEENSGAHPAAVPFMAPPRPAQPLTGRQELLAQLQDSLLRGYPANNLALVGLPGVGKTSLAAELACAPQIQAAYPDGILWAGLGRQPDVLTGLGNWAAALAIAPEAVAGAVDVPARSALLHAAIGLRRMLLVVDDAWQAEAALAFKVGGPNCAHLLTTRLPEAALSFAGAQVVTVHELDVPQGLSLLAQLSPQAVAADPQAARVLVQQVGGLPLALILVGGYLQRQGFGAQPRRIKEALANLQAVEARHAITQPQAPLEQHPGLPPGAQLSLHSVIGLSDAALAPAAHQALLDLALFPPKPNTFSEEAALAVTAACPAVLDGLVDRGLVECVEDGRYTLHQTICDYARLESPPAPPAFERMIAYYLGFVYTNAANVAVLAREIGNVLNVCEAVYRAERYEDLLALIDQIYGYLETRGLYQTGELYLRRAREAANTLGSQVNQAAVMGKLGNLDLKRGQFISACQYLRESIRLARAVGAGRVEVTSWIDLGLASMYAGDVLAGRHALEQSLPLARSQGLLEEESYALNSLGFVCSEGCDFQAAREYLQAALQLAHRINCLRSIGWAHFNLSMVELPLGNFAAALSEARQCEKYYHMINDRRGEGWLIYHYGRIARQQGDFAGARAYFEQAVAVLGELGDWMGYGFALHNLGLVCGEQGQIAAARAWFGQALEIFERISCRTGINQCLGSLGVLCRRCGDLAGAQDLLEKALLIRQQIYYPRGISMAFNHLGLMALYQNDFEQAENWSAEAVGLARGMNALPTLAFTLMQRGRVLLGMGRLDAAEAAFAEAAALRRQMEQPHLLLDPLAGLVEVRCQRGDAAGAAIFNEELLDHLVVDERVRSLADGLAGVDDPGTVYLAAWHGLQAGQDARAAWLLQEIYQRLQESTAGLSAGQQQMFWQNLPAHRIIAAAAEKDCQWLS